MIAAKNDHQRVLRILKNKAMRQAGAAFENICRQFANAEPAVDVRVAKHRAELKQGENGGHSFVFGQPSHLL